MSASEKGLPAPSRTVASADSRLVIVWSHARPSYESRAPGSARTSCERWILSLARSDPSQRSWSSIDPAPPPVGNRLYVLVSASQPRDSASPAVAPSPSRAADAPAPSICRSASAAFPAASDSTPSRSTACRGGTSAAVADGSRRNPRGSETARSQLQSVAMRFSQEAENQHPPRDHGEDRTQHDSFQRCPRLCPAEPGTATWPVRRGSRQGPRERAQAAFSSGARARSVRVRGLGRTVEREPRHGLRAPAWPARARSSESPISRRRSLARSLHRGGHAIFLHCPVPAGARGL